MGIVFIAMDGVVFTHRHGWCGVSRLAICFAL